MICAHSSRMTLLKRCSAEKINGCKEGMHCIPFALWVRKERLIRYTLILQIF